MACVAVITMGTLVTTRGELALSRVGLALQLSANFAEASRLVLSQRLLSNVKLPLFEMQYHVAPTQLVCLLAAAAVIEFQDAVDRQAALNALHSHPLLFVWTGMLGLVLQVVGLLALRVAGSVAVKLLGIARGAGCAHGDRKNTSSTPALQLVTAPPRRATGPHAYVQM